MGSPMNTDLSTAAKWLKKATGDAGTRFLQAISRCIFCHFTSQSVNLAENDLREEFYSEVVKPVAGVETLLDE